MSQQPGMVLRQGISDGDIKRGITDLEELVPKGLCWPWEPTLTYGYILLLLLLFVVAADDWVLLLDAKSLDKVEEKWSLPLYFGGNCHDSGVTGIYLYDFICDFRYLVFLGQANFFLFYCIRRWCFCCVCWLVCSLGITKSNIEQI